MPRSRRQELEAIARGRGLTKAEYDELQALRQTPVRVQEQRQQNREQFGTRSQMDRYSESRPSARNAEPWQRRVWEFEQGVLTAFQKSRGSKFQSIGEAAQVLDQITQAASRLQQGVATDADRQVLRMSDYENLIGRVTEDRPDSKMNTRQQTFALEALGGDVGSPREFFNRNTGQMEQRFEGMPGGRSRSMMPPIDRIAEWSVPAQDYRAGLANVPDDVARQMDIEEAARAEQSGRAYQRLTDRGRRFTRPRGQRMAQTGPTEAEILDARARAMVSGEDYIPGNTTPETELRQWAAQGPEETLRRMVPNEGKADSEMVRVATRAWLQESPEARALYESRFGNRDPGELTPQELRTLQYAPEFQALRRARNPNRQGQGPGSSLEEPSAPELAGPETPRRAAPQSRQEMRLDRLYNLQDQIMTTLESTDPASADLSPFERRSLMKQYGIIERHISHLEDQIQSLDPREQEFWQSVNNPPPRERGLIGPPLMGPRDTPQSGEAELLGRMLSRIDPESGATVGSGIQSRWGPDTAKQIPLQPDEVPPGELAPTQDLSLEQMQRQEMWDPLDPESAPTRPMLDRRAPEQAPRKALQPDQAYVQERARGGPFVSRPAELLPQWDEAGMPNPQKTERFFGETPAPSGMPAPLAGPPETKLPLNEEPVGRLPWGRAPRFGAGNLFTTGAKALGAGGNALGLITQLSDLLKTGGFSYAVSKANEAGGIPLTADSQPGDTFSRVKVDPFIAALYSMLPGFDREKFMQDPDYRQQMTGVGIS